MPFGAHMSIAGGMDQAVWRGQKVGCDTIQVFVKNASRWKAKPLAPEDISRFRQALRETRISPVIAHNSYLINLASPDEDLWMKSLDALIVEVERCAALEIPFLVMHPGAHTGAGEEVGLNRITIALNEVLKRTDNSKVTILLESTAGQGSILGGRFDHLAKLLSESFNPERLGICLDTCHIFAAGYDLRTNDACEETFKEFDQIVGLDKLKAIHLNDSQGELGSRRDRHEHIGMGRIGLEGFRWIVNNSELSCLPLILETPKGPDLKEDRDNLGILRSLQKE
ncbi:MAG: deoxyribonuclease IV [Syntrophaceticus schinkii]|nr:deoxyribonuclease IV [Syntrophaceticus schinkii]MDD4262188.1 deoxyribonuclease IV [Syntrophaceticus schinkii]